MRLDSFERALKYELSLRSSMVRRANLEPYNALSWIWLGSPSFFRISLATLIGKTMSARTGYQTHRGTTGSDAGCQPTYIYLLRMRSYRRLVTE